MTTPAQTDLFSDFNAIIPSEISVAYSPYIFGGHAELHRYSASAEKPGINVGTYVSGSNTTYAFPSLNNPSSVIDQTFVSVFIDSALLRYFQHLTGGGGITITPVTNFPNRIITSSASGWKTNTNTFPRNPLLNDRDVQVGDTVHLNFSSVDFYSTVNSLIADVTAAVTGAATTDAGNPATQVAATTVTQTGGTVNAVTASSSSATLYNGYASGNINEVYTITVTQGSTGGVGTTALINVVSASGTDNQTGVAPAAFGSPTSIGARGATVTWTNGGQDFQVGQIWSFSVTGPFTKATPTSSGVYTGTTSPTYIITVTRGGRYTDATQPQISITSSLGTDQSGPTTVTAAASNVPVGTLGIQIQFAGLGLRLGDKYYIVATAPGTGAYRTIQLSTNMPASFLVATDMTLELSIQENIAVPQQALNNPPALNWSTTTSSITVNSAINAQDPTLTNAGVKFYVPVVSGPSTLVYIQYRAWLPTWLNIIGNLSVPFGTDPTPTVQAVLGTVDPANPLSYAVYQALLNSNGVPIYFTAVQDPSQLTFWQNVLNILVGLPNCYSLVPLTTLPTVLAAVKAHIDAQSVDAVGMWRRGWFNLQAVPSIAIATQANSSDNNVILATLQDDPTMAGTQYTYLTVTSGNSQFVTNGVQAGDVVRYLFSIDGFGNSTWTNFTIASVVNQTTLILALPGNGTAISVAQKVEVWRNQSVIQQAATLAATVTATADDRILYVWPDLIDTATFGSIPGYFLCAALAGFTDGIMPHQGIQGVIIPSFSGASRSTKYFSNAQLNTLSTAGAFVVTDNGSGVVFTRNALTTDQSTLKNSLEVVQRDIDTVRRVAYNRIAQFFGIMGATTAGIPAIQSELASALKMMRYNTFVARIGADMIIDDSIVSIRYSTVTLNQVIAQLTLTLPFPVGSLSLTLTF